MTEPDPRYLQYFTLFNQEKFFEAHEVLEALWLETKGGERNFYQGLIQLAASLVHFHMRRSRSAASLQKGNLTGARELFRTASAYLKPYLPQHEGVDLARTLRDFRVFLDAWSGHPDRPSLAKPLLPRLDLTRKRDA